jgi:hypothetical protein
MIHGQRFGECLRELRDAQIVCQEGRYKVVFKNPRRLLVQKIKIDGCMILTGPRCDYLVIFGKPITEVYIELKGSDIRHALRQIERTIGLFSQDRVCCQKICYVVCRNVAPQIQTRIQGEKLRLKKNYNAKLTVKSNVIEHEICG